MSRAPRGPGDRPEGELPPDPWAGLAEPLPPPSPRASADAAGEGPDPRAAEASAEAHRWHPAGRDRDDAGTGSLLLRPGVWIALTAVALFALIGAWLDRPEAPPESPSPDSISTAPAELPHP